MMPEVRQNRRNNLLAVIPELSESYSVEFEFKPTQFQSDWTNIIHLTATGNDCCKYGDTIPGVWFQPASTDATKNKLRICSAVDGSGRHCYDSVASVPRGQWTKIKIYQHREGYSYKYVVKINGAIFGPIVNNKAQKFYHVQVFGADDWNNAAQGSMRNLVIHPHVKGKIC